MAIFQNQTNQAGTAEDDSISGTAAADSLGGAAGNDTLVGGGGNDTLQGGAGTDTAKYTGNQAGYRVQAGSVAGQIIVTDIDTTNGNDGVDTLQGIENISFADASVSVNSTLNPDTQVNTYFTDAQRTVSITKLSNANYLTVWGSASQDGSGWGIYGQRFSEDGIKIGTEFRLNKTTSGDQWLSPDDDNTTQTVAGTTDGGFVAVWSSWNSDGNNWGVVAQRFDSNGVAIGNEIAVNTYKAGEQRNAAVAVLAENKFVITWMSSNSQDGSEGGIYGQLYGADGTAIGSEFKVNTVINGWQYQPRSSALSGGGFVVTWRDDSVADAKAQIFDSSASPVGNEFTVNTTTGDYQYNSSIAPLSNGGFWAVWQSPWHSGENSWGIYAQKFNSLGVKQGSEIRVNTYTADAQYQPQISTRADGSFVVVWSSSNQDGSGLGIYAQQFDASGVKAGSEQLVSFVTQGSQWKPTVLAFDNGGYVVSWESSGAQDGSDWGIFSRIWDAVKGFNALTVSGDATDNLIVQASADTIDGGAGADTMQGGTGATVYIVDNAGDVVTELANGGFDEVRSSVNYTWVSNIEKLTLTGSADITGTGNDQSNFIVGNAGNNLLVGAAGNDTLNGAGGNDTLRGDLGNDTIDGGGGYNTYVVTGRADAFSWTVNSAGQVVLTDMVVNAADLVDGSDEGVDTLSNIQAIEYRLPDGTLDLKFVLDDFSNAPDTGNYQIQYGTWVSGRANFYGDLDYFKLQTTSGQKVVLSSSSGSTSGHLGSIDSGYSVQGQSTYTYSSSTQTLTWSSTDLVDVYWNSNELSSTSRMASKGYGFILRRQLDGSDASETLTAGTTHEYLVGGGGNDTLIGSARSDMLFGGDGNDVMTGLLGNDEIDGGSGTANVAIFSGNKSDYSVTWRGENLSLAITDKVAGRDGTDLLSNVQILRFADGDVVLDAESNVAPALAAVSIGSSFTGTLPLVRSTDSSYSVDVDYFQQRISSDVSTESSLRLTITTNATQNVSGQGYLNFNFVGTNDVLSFTDKLNGGTRTNFDFNLSQGTNEFSWMLSPLKWGNSTDFLATSQRADARVWGYAYDNTNTAALGSLVSYTIRIDRVILGTSGAETLRGDSVSGYIDALAGNDSVIGGDLSEQIVGGFGDDTIDGGAGDDVITDSAGLNRLTGGSGNDLFNLTGTSTPTATIQGGDGVDTLKITNGTVWTGLSASGVEVLDGAGGLTSLTPAQVLEKGFTTAQNITFKLPAAAASGSALDGSGLLGALNLRGSNQSDVLTGNDQNNIIYLGSDENAGSGGGADTVVAAGGDDTIVLSTRYWSSWNQFFTSADSSTRTYRLSGQIDGGAGQDSLELNFNEIIYTNSAWAGYFYQDTTGWKLDLSSLTLKNVESLIVRGDKQSTSLYPSELILTAAQLQSLTSTVGLPSVAITGGGTVSVGHLSGLGVTSWRIADSESYVISGTTAADVVSVGAGTNQVSLGDGNDEIVIENKSLVKDVLNGGAGNDTLTIRGTDVDLSGATLTNIETIKVASQSLSMSAAQWLTLGDKVQMVSGANTAFILSVSEPGTVSLLADSVYLGLTGSSGDDQLLGNAANNILVGGAGSDSLNGFAGNDRLVTGAGLDTLIGGDGNDTLVISDKTIVRDVISGGAGKDTLQVSDGQDLSLADISGIEVLQVTGTVTLTADQISAISEISGGTVQLVGTSSAYILPTDTKLTQGAKILLPSVDSTISSTSGLVGSKGDDTISGNAGDDVIYGGRGSDYLIGAAGNDTIAGGSGTDTIVGGAGDDIIIALTPTEYGVSWGQRIYSDLIDGGTGTDTLLIRFNGGESRPYFHLTPGAVYGIEQLEIEATIYQPRIVVTADQWSKFSKVRTSSTQGWSDAWITFEIQGEKGQNLDLNAITTDSKLRTFELSGQFGEIDVSSVSGIDISISSLDSVKLGSGNDKLTISAGDQKFSINAGAGDDLINLRGNKLVATIVGGTGTDVLDVANNSIVDLTQTELTGIESINYGTTRLVLTQAQLDAWSFDGSGAKYTKSGTTIVGTSGNDSYNGDGTGWFKGAAGNDSLSQLNTVVFSGNYEDYDFTRSGDTLTVQQARGDMLDGTDTLYQVMNMKFANTVVAIDDQPDSWQQFRPDSLYSLLTNAAYDKRVSAKKNFASDVDVFSSTLVPNSPLSIEASALNGSSLSFNFFEKSTGQQIVFKSLVNGSIIWTYSNWMSADSKWLPGFYTSEGFKAYEGGEVIIQANIGSDASVNKGITDYAFTLKFLDDYSGSTSTLGVMDAQVGQVKGYIGELKDSDWIKTNLIAGTKYEFKLTGLSSGGGTLVDPKLQLLDSEGRVVESGFDLASDVTGFDDTLVFRPTTSGAYYLAVTDVAGINTGSWTLSQQSLDTIAGNTSTTERVSWATGNNFTVTSEVNVLSDHDWFKVWLDQGMTYKFRAQGSSAGGTLSDPQLSLRSIGGVLLAQDDNSGGATDAEIVYSAPDAGWYYLDVGASGNAYKGTYVLKGSTLADDFSNDLLTTGTVQVGTPVQGLVSYNGDSDWFKVGLSKGRTYVIDLKGDISDSAQLDPLVDPLLLIRDSTGKIVFKADDFDRTLDARAYFTPTADGLYFLESKSAFKYDIGAYQLSVSLAPADDVGDLRNATATTLTLSTSQTGNIGIPGDKDVFKVSLLADSVYQIQLNGLSGHSGTLADPYLRVFDANGHLIDFDNNSAAGNDASLSLAPTVTGLYYIEATSNQGRGMGTYSLNVSKRDLPPDDAANNISTQVRLTPGESFNGQLLTHNDQDWVGIRLEGAKNYIFRVQASRSGNGTLEDPVLEIRAADGTLIRSIDNMLIGNEPATVFTPTATGDFYLVVKAANGQVDTGSYVLVSRAPDDYGNTLQSAQALTLNQAVNGAIQWSDGAYGVRAMDSVGLATDADEDWFKFTAALGDVLSLTVQATAGSTLSRPLLEIVDGQGRSLAFGDGLETQNSKAVATFKAAAAGTYYARLIDGAGASGSYTMTLTAGDVSDEDSQSAVSMSFVSNASILQAQNTARIGLPGDSDKFVVDLVEGHAYRIETLAVRDGSIAPLGAAEMSLNFRAAGSTTGSVVAIDREAGSVSFFDSTLFEASKAGTMTITVKAPEVNQTGQYKIRVVDLGGAIDDSRPDTVAKFVDATHGVLASNDQQDSKIDSADDIDLYAINLTAGNLYDFTVKSSRDGLGTLAEAQLRLLDAKGNLVTAGTYNDATGRTDLDVSVFETGRYYLAVSATDIPGNIGTYALETRLRDTTYTGTDDLSADTRSGALAKPGKPVTGRIEYDEDHDWVKVELQAGKVYVLDVLAKGNGAGGTLSDATLRLLDANGQSVMFDDNSGAGNDAHMQFTAETTGVYYLDVGSNLGALGTYTVRVRELYSGIADPLSSAQWYLESLGLSELNGQLTGDGVSVGMIDDGIDTAHPDLQLSINFADAYDAALNTTDGKHKTILDAHGTAVAGIIVGVANNETGIVGIAPDAQIVSTRVGWDWGSITEALGRQVQFDISNNSWGAIAPFSDNFNSTTLTFAYEALRNGVEDGRKGLGTIFVFSAGNSGAYGENTNYHNFQNAREVITVGAAQADGSPAGFSTPGASVLVGAYGVNLLTTDRHEVGLGYNKAGNYTSFSGTSAAAPVVSAVVALMLEANPNLGYRDVQEILVYSAIHPDNQDWKTNAGYEWNLGGLKFNDQLGFGLVDAYNAVQLAETWTNVKTAINEVSDSARAFGLNLAIPDDATSLTRSFVIDNAMTVEHIELGIDLRHTRLGDLIIQVISPNGTVSTLMDRPTVNSEMPFGLSSADSGVPTHLLWDFSSVQFWGENAVGTWTVVVKDVRAEETGSIGSFSLRVYGARDDGNDTYVFTDEAFLSETTRVLQDEQGLDVINASAVTTDLLGDLSAGQIASQTVVYKIADWTQIENLVSGRGNDNLVGNDVDNKLQARAGDDTIKGGAGNDTIEGGDGQDTAVYAGNKADFSVSWNSTTKKITVIDNKSTNGDEGIDVLTGIERIVFADAEMKLGALVGNKAPVANTTFFDAPVFLSAGMGIDFVLPETAFSDVDSDPTSLDVQVSSASGGELPDWLSYDPLTRQFTGVPPADYQGQLKLKVSALDEFGEESSDILTLQFGSNQAPTVSNPSEKVLNEDADQVTLGLSVPVDPEGKVVSVKILEVPGKGKVFTGTGQELTVDMVITADALDDLVYQTAADANGSAGYLRYQATDADGVSAESSVRIVIDAVNDAPRFATKGSALTVQYPTTAVIALDMAIPSDPESVLQTVKLIELPAMGKVTLDATALTLNQVLTFDQLSRLKFSLNENVNGPIGSVTIQATDPQGSATNWSLALTVQGQLGSGLGTAAADTMYGSIGNDTLYGFAGDDTLVGNAGNDRLLGGLGNDLLYGSSGDDMLDGSSGGDLLDGGAGNDTMAGGPGNDTYVLDAAGDVVLEVISGSAGGKDLIVTTITRSAPDNVESLQAAGNAAINLTGNALDNTLLGNDAANSIVGGVGRDTLLGQGGNDTLDGGVGVDRLAGGAGDDLYFVDSRSDVIVELANEGVDTVRASSSYTLSSNVENLTLEEGGDYTAGGNSMSNHLKGNSGNNVLAGGLGRDTLEGGLGNDTYVLSDNLDTILDTGGTDTIRSMLDIALSAGIENAELVGLSDVSALGNAADNLLVGNAGSNLLEGGAGVDTLTGGEGGDQFMIAYNGAGKNPDVITDFVSGTDLLMIDFSSLGLSAQALSLLSSGALSADSFVKGVGVNPLDPNDYFILDTATGILYFDEDGSGPLSRIPLVKFTGGVDTRFNAGDVFVCI